MIHPSEGHFGERLALLRQKAGFSQREFARVAVSLPRTSVDYEPRAPLSHGHLLSSLANTLGLSVDELVGNRPAKSTKRSPQLSPRHLRRLSLVEQLPLKDKRELFSIIDMYLSKNHLSDAQR